MATEETLRPSAEEFVLRVAASDEATLTRARRLGPVERLGPARDLCLLRVPQRATPQATWAAVATEWEFKSPLSHHFRRFCTRRSFHPPSGIRYG